MTREERQELNRSLRRRIAEVQRSIAKALERVPEHVVNGSIQTTAAWKYAAHKASTSPICNKEPGASLKTPALQQRLYTLQALKERLT